MNISSAGKIIAKTLGISTLALVGYDAYKCGQWQGKMSYKNSSADWMVRINEDAQLLDNHSQVRSAAKRKFNGWFINSGIAPFWSGIGGFLKGLGSSVINNAVPFALAAGALCLKRGDRLCALGLGLYAAKYFIHDMLGVGKIHYLTDSPY